MRLLAALFLIRKLPLLTVFLIGLALLLPVFFVLLMLGRLISMPPPKGGDQHHSQSRAPARATPKRDFEPAAATIKSAPKLPVVAMFAGSRSAPPAQETFITKDQRAANKRAFQQHNSFTTDSLRNLSDSYENGFRAYHQKHPVIPGSQYK